MLLALAAPALGMRLGFPDAGNDPPDTMTRQAYDLNTEGFGPGHQRAAGDRRRAARSGRAKARSTRSRTRLRAEDGVAFVPTRRSTRRATAAIVTVIPTSSPQDKADGGPRQPAARRRRARARSAAPAITAEIGGVTAALEDQSEYMKDRMPLFIAGVVGLSFLLLLVAFHSPLISLKAAVMNLLSVSAAYGVMTLVAKGGAVGGLIGIDHEVPVAPFMPVMMFAILFGLSMDYEVFLISRIREEYLKDGDTRRAVADGLAKTARVITAAAAIMVVVFLAFLAAPDVFLKLFGIGLASAIFLDATVVRMVLVPGRDAAARQAATGGSRTGWSGSCRGWTSSASRSAPRRDGPSRARPTATRPGRRTRGRDDAALSIEVQLHAGDLGQADRQPRGPPKGRSVVHRVGRWEAPRVLVRLRHTRRLQPVGGPRQRVHGRGCAGDQWRRCAQLVRNDSPPDRRRNDGCPAQGRASPVPSARLRNGLGVT